MADNEDEITFKKFQILVNKLSSLMCARSEDDKKNINYILEELNSLNYNVSFIKNHETAVLAINLCCYIVPHEDQILSKKSCNLIQNLIKNQQVLITGKTLSLALNWCLECLKFASEGLKVDILMALACLLKGNSSKVDQHYYELFDQNSGILVNIIKTNSICELKWSAFKCIEAFVFPSDEKLSEDILELCYNIIYQQIETVNDVDAISSKIIVSSIKAISNIIQQSGDILQSKIGELLGLVKTFMLFGLPGYDGVKLGKLLASRLSVSENTVRRAYTPSKGIKGKYDKKSKKKNVSHIDVIDTDIGIPTEIEIPSSLLPVWCKTSDSEFSDSESGQVNKLRSSQGKVRQSSIIMLALIIKLYTMKEFVGYLNHFLPDGGLQQSRTLITCLLKDPSAQSRREILAVLSTILQDGKNYFVQAEVSKTTSFTTFSLTLGNILKELHRCLGLTLIAENSINVITLILKCIADLIRCTPYHKLPEGIISKLARHVRSYINHKDVHVQCAALTVFGCIISAERKTKEITDFILKTSQEPGELKQPNSVVENDEDLITEEDYEDDFSLDGKPWILNICINNILDQSEADRSQINSGTPLVVIIESLQVLGSLFKNFFRSLAPNFLTDIIEALTYSVNKSEYLIKLYGGKLMVAICNSLQINLVSEDESERLDISLIMYVWTTILQGPLISLIQSDDQPTLRATGCDCLTNMGVPVTHSPSSHSSLIFDQLSRDKQILCITVLFGSSRDDYPLVRSSAIRALAVYVLFPSLREDSLFLFDIVDTIKRGSKDEVVGVRSQTAWLLGNFSEILILNRQENIEDNITVDVRYTLLEIGIQLSEDVVKVKPNAVRGVGNLLKLVHDEDFNKYRQVINRGIEVLLKTACTASLMKARWNSCYALSNSLQNISIQKNLDYITKIFSCMTKVIKDCKNFKVRISACSVLSAPNDRSTYANFYIDLWSSLLQALENTKNVSDLAEYKHRDNLIDHICLTLSHMISLAVLSDIIIIQEKTLVFLDVLNQHMYKFQDRVVPEKSDSLLKALANIEQLGNNKLLNSEQKSGIEFLKSIFDMR